MGGEIMSQQQGYFIAGTDTEVGKTLVSCALLRWWQQQGYSTAAVKPVAAGAEMIAGEWQNADAIALRQACTQPLNYQQVNPCCVPVAASPHIAADLANVSLDAETIIRHCQATLCLPVQRVLVEGAGGWYAPLSEQQSMADVALGLGLPVILVVGMRLGCLNHALLSYQAISASQLPIAGWIANHIENDMPYAKENVDYLAKSMDTPLLANIPFIMKGDDYGAYFSACLQ